MEDPDGEWSLMELSKKGEEGKGARDQAMKREGEVAEDGEDDFSLCVGSGN
jgi:hypothetical protein